MSNTLISDNGDAIDIHRNGSGTTYAALSITSKSENNSSEWELGVSTDSQTINVTVTDSVIANNGATGI